MTEGNRVMYLVHYNRRSQEVRQYKPPAKQGDCGTTRPRVLSDIVTRDRGQHKKLGAFVAYPVCNSREQ